MKDDERDRENKVRKVGCKVCLAKPKQRCRYELDAGMQPYAHTGRYREAARRRLVPRLVGD